MSVRCDFVSCLPYVSSCDGDIPEARRTGWIKTPCPNDVLIVRYENGIIVKGYCKTHCTDMRLSLHPWKGAEWERYDEAKHYGAGQAERGQ